MIPISFRRFWLNLGAAASLTGAAGCGDSLGLPPPGIPNEVDTTTLFALTGTPIATPSAFDVVNRSRSHTDLDQPFDFAFELDAEDQARIFPAPALGAPNNAGLQLSDLAFGEVKSAPFDGYQSEQSLEVAAETVFIARSRAASQFCIFLGALPRYGKFRVLAVDPAERSITLEFLVNANCGFRGLEPGIPDS